MLVWALCYCPTLQISPRHPTNPFIPLSPPSLYKHTHYTSVCMWMNISSASRLKSDPNLTVNMDRALGKMSVSLNWKCSLRGHILSVWFPCCSTVLWIGETVRKEDPAGRCRSLVLGLQSDPNPLCAELSAPCSVKTSDASTSCSHGQGWIYACFLNHRIVRSLLTKLHDYQGSYDGHIFLMMMSHEDLSSYQFSQLFGDRNTKLATSGYTQNVFVLV